MTVLERNNLKLSEAQFERLADCLKVLASPLRLRLLMIVGSGEWTVGEIAGIAGVNASVASIHLHRMSDRGCIKATRKANRVYFTIAEPAVLSALQAWLCCPTALTRNVGRRD